MSSTPSTKKEHRMVSHGHAGTGSWKVKFLGDDHYSVMLKEDQRHTSGGIFKKMSSKTFIERLRLLSGTNWVPMLDWMRSPKSIGSEMIVEWNPRLELLRRIEALQGSVFLRCDSFTDRKMCFSSWKMVCLRFFEALNLHLAIENDGLPPVFFFEFVESTCKQYGWSKKILYLSSVSPLPSIDELASSDGLILQCLASNEERKHCFYLALQRHHDEFIPILCDVAYFESLQVGEVTFSWEAKRENIMKFLEAGREANLSVLRQMKWKSVSDWFDFGQPAGPYCCLWNLYPILLCMSGHGRDSLGQLVDLLNTGLNDLVSSVAMKCAPFSLPQEHLVGDSQIELWTSRKDNLSFLDPDFLGKPDFEKVNNLFKSILRQPVEKNFLEADELNVVASESKRRNEFRLYDMIQNFTGACVIDSDVFNDVCRRLHHVTVDDSFLEYVELLVLKRMLNDVNDVSYDLRLRQLLRDTGLSTEIFNQRTNVPQHMTLLDWILFHAKNSLSPPLSGCADESANVKVQELLKQYTSEDKSRGQSGSRGRRRGNADDDDQWRSKELFHFYYKENIHTTVNAEKKTRWYHGTVLTCAFDILREQVRPASSRKCDFSCRWKPGFYVSDDFQCAWEWATQKASEGEQRAVVVFEFDVQDVEGLLDLRQDLVRWKEVVSSFRMEELPFNVEYSATFGPIGTGDDYLVPHSQGWKQICFYGDVKAPDQIAFPNARLVGLIVDPPVKTLSVYTVERSTLEVPSLGDSRRIEVPARVIRSKDAQCCAKCGNFMLENGCPRCSLR